MAFFGNKEEKQAKKQEKEEQKVQDFINYYKLGDIDEREFENLLDLARSSTALSLIGSGNYLAGNEKDYLQQITYQNEFLRDQNFIIIKQLDRLNKNLEKLLDK